MIALFLRLLAIIGGRVYSLRKLIKRNNQFWFIAQFVLLKVSQEYFVEDHDALIDNKLLLFFISPKILIEQAFLLITQAS